ncbi:hypothetical protein PENSPDRAFT_655144 [Peniophora sp. CONT]|nr:hypothetical protein PENSPDRAFT_655144 [Peniophora sp. CONT]
MASSSSSEAALKLEIAKLTGAINQKKSSSYQQTRPTTTYNKPRGNAYVNPNYKPPSTAYVRPGYAPPPRNSKPPVRYPTAPGPAQQARDVTLNGVAFESSSRSLVRKEIAASKPPSQPRPPRSNFKQRPFKPKPPRRPGNMTLNNNRRPFQPRQKKSINKPCPRFNTTGSCNRGLTCPYKHDAATIGICWPFLQGTCPNSADTCALSHDPTPERTPLCVHFANNGRCTRARCPFPHAHLPPRSGVCRDFAVLGYCAKGFDCEHQHVRECPDFAESGECKNKHCKLPHVIRANRVRKTAATTSTSTAPTPTTTSSTSGSGSDTPQSPVVALSAESAKLGDEFISLTFNESESEEEEEEEVGSEEEEESGEEDEVEEGDGSPTDERM